MRLERLDDVSLLLATVQSDDKTREWISFFKPNATIAVIDHFQSYPRNAIPPQASAVYAR